MSLSTDWIRTILIFLLVFLGVPFLMGAWPADMDAGIILSNIVILFTIVCAAGGLISYYYSPVLSRYLVGMSVFGFILSILTPLVFFITGQINAIIPNFSTYFPGMAYSLLLFWAGSIIGNREAQFPEKNRLLDLNGNPIPAEHWRDQKWNIGIAILGAVMGIIWGI